MMIHFMSLVPVLVKLLPREVLFKATLDLPAMNKWYTLPQLWTINSQHSALLFGGLQSK